MFSNLAYIDPTAGGVLIQVLFGGTVAVFVFIKIFWRKLIGLFGFSRPAQPTIEDAEKKP